MKSTVRLNLRQSKHIEERLGFAIALMHNSTMGDKEQGLVGMGTDVVKI
jgi:hypothetical protein